MLAAALVASWDGVWMGIGGVWRWGVLQQLVLLMARVRVEYEDLTPSEQSLRFFSSIVKLLLKLFKLRREVGSVSSEFLARYLHILVFINERLQLGDQLFYEGFHVLTAGSGEVRVSLLAEV